MRESQELLARCRLLKTNCDFPALLQEAFRREQERVLDHGEEDDLDGWELESNADAADPADAHPPAAASPSSAAPSASSPTPLPNVPAPSMAGPSSLANAPAQPALDQPTHRRTRRGGSSKRKRNAHAQERSKQYAKHRKVVADQQAKERQHEDARKYTPSPYAIKKIEDIQILPTDFDALGLHAARGGFVGKRVPVQGGSSEVQGYLRQGYTLFRWDGA